MANADPLYNDHPVNSYDDEDSEDEATTSKQNGTFHRNVDRYGFIGGSQYTNPDEEKRLSSDKLRKREIKWLDMFDNWEKWMNKRFKKVKDRCRKGIPPSMRARAWQYLCGSNFQMEHSPGKYQEYLNQPGDPRWMDEIHKDLHRQFPMHEMFAGQGGLGQEDLFCILKAYTLHNKHDGYCQAQGPIAAVLLMHMPAEQAFWCLVSICEKYLPSYYSPGLEAVQVDGDVLYGLLKKSSPTLYKHMKKQNVEPLLYMTEWFMCAFARTLPWVSVLRVWDMFFCEGVKVIFRVALVLLKLVFDNPERLSADCPTIYETLEKLKHIPPELFEEDLLIREALRLNITERDMEREHQRQINRRKVQEKKRKEEN